MGNGQNHQEAAAIYVNNKEFAVATSDSSDHADWDQATSRAIVHLNAGDRVCVKNNMNSNAQYYGYREYTSFNGVLVHAD